MEVEREGKTCGKCRWGRDSNLGQLHQGLRPPFMGCVLDPLHHQHCTHCFFCFYTKPIDPNYKNTLPEHVASRSCSLFCDCLRHPLLHPSGTVREVCPCTFNE
ncbi:hypothetical protein AMECASPLE_018188 [Ameca splendens]|uniref:Uncharacterized protein n=1 Tax=Ameca splendens TaxID=208324 RepID=A0ABV0Y2G8_9TELE